MKLAECTKAELLFILGQLSRDFGTSFEIDRLLFRVESARNDRKYSKADEVLKRSRETLEAYNKLVEPYEGVPLKDIPDDVIHQANELLKAHVEADREWCRLMGIGVKEDKVDRPRKRTL